MDVYRKRYCQRKPFDDDIVSLAPWGEQNESINYVMTVPSVYTMSSFIVASRFHSSLSSF